MVLCKHLDGPMVELTQPYRPLHRKHKLCARPQQRGHRGVEGRSVQEDGVLVGHDEVRILAQAPNLEDWLSNLFEFVRSRQKLSFRVGHPTAPIRRPVFIPLGY